MQSFLLFFLPLLITSKTTIPFESLKVIADNLNSLYNNINPNKYFFTLPDCHLEFEIKAITSLVSYDKRLISSTSRGDTITYTDFNVTLYYSFTFNSIEHPHSEQYNIVTKKGLYANLFYTQFELNQNLDGMLAFTDGSPDVTEIELGDIEDYIMFKEIYKNDSEMLKDKLVSAWVEDLHGIFETYPKGYPTNIFDAIVDKLYKDSDYSLEKVQGVVKGRLREIEYEKRTTMGAAQKFENVSMKVIYATKEQMITKK